MSDSTHQPIQKLPAHVIRHIAAGEVIDRPFSVVKELIENALDAQATRIEVFLEKAGQQRIVVKDNGSGVTAEELPLVFTRYATSKLSDLEDLLHLFSLGFRGEALYSIAAVADVSFQTKTAKEIHGSEIRSIRGQLQPILPIGHRVGTTIDVQQLFEAFPVRQQSIVSRREVQDITQLLQAYSLEFPLVSFQLHHNGKGIWSSYAGETYHDRIEQVWQLTPTQGLSLTTHHPYVNVQGWISTPENFVRQRKNIFCFINHRLVDDRSISKAILEGLKTFSHRQLFPKIHLSLEIPPEFIDVNLHPQKKVVQFLHSQEILHVIQRAVTETLQQAPTAHLRYTGSNLFPEMSVHEQTPFSVLAPIVQIDQTYLLVPTNRGFLLVDQHAADERLWYNRLIKEKKLLHSLEKKLDEETQQELEDDEYLHSFDPNINAKIAVIACHSAIRAGESLDQATMKKVVTNILAAENEGVVCPHGRPTYIQITVQQLARMFRR